MKHWEKNKKDVRRLDDRDFRQNSFQDQKKKKLKPTEKTKYKARGYDEDDE